MQLTELISQTTARLGTNVDTLFTEAEKTLALNTVRRRLILEYNLQEFIKVSSVAVASGVGTFPSDYVRIVKEKNAQGKTVSLWINEVYYEKVTPTRFYDNIDYTWTVKQDTAGGSFEIYPADSGTYNLRHIYKPSDMSDPTDQSGLPAQFDELHPLMAARQLLFDNRQYDSASAMDEEIARISGGFNKGFSDYGNKRTSSLSSILDGEPLIL
jgi:hypothetical protein